MEINKKVFIELFKENFNYPIVDTPLGNAVKMDAYSAFIFSAVTGSSYLDNPIYPLHLQSLFKIFNKACSYEFITGLFEGTKLLYTPYNMCLEHPFLTQGDKYIIAVEFESQIELQNILKNYIKILKSFDIPSTDFIIQRIDTSKKGYGLENLMEYFAAEYFRKKGYIVENQIPIAHNVGSPDLGAFKLEHSQAKLSTLLNIKSGFHIFELAMLRIFKGKYSLDTILESNNIYTNEILVGEAKTSTKIMKKQLDKYIATGLFDLAYEIHPSKIKSSSNYLGLISFKDNLIKDTTATSQLPPSNNTYPYSKDEYITWLNNYLKYYLISNLSTEEFDNFCKDRNLKSSLDITKFINNLSISDILSTLNSIIK